MHKFTVPSLSEGYSVWIELSTFDELPLEQRRKTRPTMAESMAKKSMIEIESHYGLTTHAIPYSDVIKAFPDIDPEITYVTVHFKSHRPYKWPPLM